MPEKQAEVVLKETEIVPEKVVELVVWRETEVVPKKVVELEPPT